MVSCCMRMTASSTTHEVNLYEKYSELRPMHHSSSMGLNREERRKVVNLEDDHDVYTHDLVLCSSSQNAFPVELLQTFHYEKKGSVVSEIWYDPETAVIHAHGTVHDEKDDFGELCDVEDNRLYARLLTTNWWYGTLSQTLLISALILLGKNSLVFFCFHLVYNHGHQSFPMSLSSRVFVVSVIILSQLASLRSAINRSKVEFSQKNDTKDSGDLVHHELSSKWDRNMPYFALVLFHCLEVNVLIRDIVKYLHPHKNKQPFCAFKADGHRAFLIGFQSEHAYRSKLSTLSSDDLVADAIMQFAIIACQAYAAAADRSPAYLIYIVCPLCVMLNKFRDAYFLALHKEKYWPYLKHAYDHGSPADKKDAEKHRAKQFPNCTWDSTELHERRWLLLKICGALFLLSCGLFMAFETHKNYDWLIAQFSQSGKS